MGLPRPNSTVYKGPPKDPVELDKSDYSNSELLATVLAVNGCSELA